MTRRRWITDEWDETSALLKGEQATHLARVLRAQIGMECDIVTGDQVRHAVVSEVSDAVVRFTLLEEVKVEPALPVTLLLAVFKFDRMEWVLEKATELGVERVVPMIARRTEKHLAQAAPARIDRWRRIVSEAARQSRRSDVPVVEDVLPVRSAVLNKARQPGLNLLLAEQERSTTLYAALQLLLQPVVPQTPPIHFAIGPEGGWTDEEESLFVSESWQPVSLGPRILRAETAGIAAMAVVSAMLGHIPPPSGVRR